MQASIPMALQNRSPIAPRHRSRSPGVGAVRQNRRQALLDASAALFSQRGFDNTTLRDIAAASGLLPGSIYCHFPSKDEIYLAVQRQGLQHLAAAVESAIQDVAEPWARLEAACIAHLTVVLGDSDYAAATVNPAALPGERIAEQIAALRDEYEKIFRQLVDDLHVPPGTNRKYLRLALLGSLNWTRSWYRPGRDTPARLAVEIVWLYRCGLDPG
jgi:AcrR family transcriptional regulator